MNETSRPSIKARAFRTKEEVREFVWGLMEERGLVTFPRPCRGRIPNFTGAGEAAERLRGLREWREAKVVFFAPDSSLHQARSEALREGKTIIVAAPGLKGFYLLKDVEPGNAFEASSIKGFSRFGHPVSIGPGLAPELPKVGLYVTGAVAVDRRGNRIGKGTGYGDREDEILSSAGLVDEETPRAALVHGAQVFEDLSHLMKETDRKVSLIITPQEVYWAHRVDEPS